MSRACLSMLELMSSTVRLLAVASAEGKEPCTCTGPLMSYIHAQEQRHCMSCVLHNQHSNTRGTLMGGTEKGK